jgi:hypothetical protein
MLLEKLPLEVFLDDTDAVREDTDDAKELFLVDPKDEYDGVFCSVSEMLAT